ncbi:group II intron maturase-specific domain-containing protein [Nonomuraea mangrovi]|uniref:Group II intron maturase-specific domain-containing protein n=1 Tax=Nonomuraea mangrovi TaxID=2316207 RepID=A0ABW4T2R1_9ACTN
MTQSPADGCSAQQTPSSGNQGSPEIRRPPNRVNSRSSCPDRPASVSGQDSRGPHRRRVRLSWPNIRRQRKRGTNELVVYTRPSRKAVQAIKDRISERTYRHTLNQSLGTLLRRLSQKLAGWANYFRHGVSKKTFDAIDHHAWQRIARWLLRKHRIPRSHLRRFCDQGWRFAEGSVAFRGASGVAIVRYRYRGAAIPNPWTWTIEPAASS